MAIYIGHLKGVSANKLEKIEGQVSEVLAHPYKVGATANILMKGSIEFVYFICNSF